MAEVSVGVEHDLAHYAVETTLWFRRAFYGLIAEGMSIEEFAVPSAARRLDLPYEAVLTEFIVGLIQVEKLNGTPYADFNGELRRTVANSRRPLAPPPAISDRQLHMIRSMWSNLCERWAQVPENDTLVLSFPATLQ